jgi:chromosome segregation ATPase
MKPSLHLILGAAIVFAGGVAARGDDQANSPEARLRDALKNTMMQLRTVTTDRDNLQAQVDDLKSQTTDLTSKVTDLTKKAAQSQDADNKTITVLKSQVSDQETSIAALQEKLKEWMDSQKNAVKIANDTEAKRAKLADLSIHLQRIVDDQQRKNTEMFKLGMELLNRYEKYGLGQALTAKEPFLGITRAKFQSLVQDYGDKLTDQRITEAPAQKPKP